LSTANPGHVGHSPPDIVERCRHSVARCCALFQVSRAAYYQRRRRPTAVQDPTAGARDVDLIQRAFAPGRDVDRRY
jgi:hypothetical protein